MSFISDEILILLLHVSVKLLNKENLQLVVCSNLFTVQIHIMLFLYFFFKMTAGKFINIKTLKLSMMKTRNKHRAIKHLEF